MKKIISVILLLTLCLGLFAGCDKTPAVEPASDLELAKTQVFNLYKPSTKDEVPVKSADYEVVTSVLVAGVPFSVEWSVEVTNGAADAVKIVDGSSSAYKKVTLPTDNDTPVEYTLTATVKDAQGNSESVSFKFIAPIYVNPYITIAEAIAIGSAQDHNEYTEMKYYVTGEITEVYNTQYGNMKLKDEEGNILTIYGTYSADGSARYDAMEVKPVAGDTVTIYGIVGQYNNSAQIKNGWIVKHTPGSGSSEEPTDPVEPSEPQLPPVTDPAEGKAYKFGMYQVTNGYAVYLAGGVSGGRYLATTQNWDEALDVYAEKSGDGIKIATTVDGQKVYVTFGLNDAGKKALSYTAEGTVLKYNAELHVWYTTLDGKEVYIGSYSNFDTMSISETSYINAENSGISQFPAGFFEAKAEAGETPDDTTTEPSQPSGGETTDDTLTNGCKVVIYNPAHKKALSSLPSSEGSYYQKGVDVTVSGSAVSGYADTEVWTVVINDDGTYSFEQGGKKLGMQDSYSSMSLGAKNDKWELVVVSEGLYLVKNVARGNCIEWYSDKNNWSTYTGTGDLFNLSFYIVG